MTVRAQGRIGSSAGAGAGTARKGTVRLPQPADARGFSGVRFAVTRSSGTASRSARLVLGRMAGKLGADAEPLQLGEQPDPGDAEDARGGGAVPVGVIHHRADVLRLHVGEGLAHLGGCAKGGSPSPCAGRPAARAGRGSRPSRGPPRPRSRSRARGRCPGSRTRKTCAARRARCRRSACRARPRARRSRHCAGQG